MTAPQPGDFAVTSIAGTTGRLISLAERLCGDGFTQYDHALIYIGGGAGNQSIVEAEPGGARCRVITDWNAGYQLCEWSTGAIRLSPAQRTAIIAAAKSYIGTPYSFLDYLALAAHHLHIPGWLPFWFRHWRLVTLKTYVADTGHMICSQLTDRCYQDAGVHLFADNRWNGYVTPADLAAVIA